MFSIIWELERLLFFGTIGARGGRHCEAEVGNRMEDLFAIQVTGGSHMYLNEIPLNFPAYNNSDRAGS
jgi:hypothetical protein